MNDIMAHKVATTMREKANEMLQACQNEWSTETLHALVGEFAGYIIGVADGIDFYLSLQEMRDKNE